MYRAFSTAPTGACNVPAVSPAAALVEAMCRAMESIGVALMVVDRQARIRSANLHARSLISGPLLRVQDERLLGRARSDTARLHGAIQAALSGSGAGAARSVLLHGEYGEMAHPVSVSPLNCSESGERLAIVIGAVPKRELDEGRLRQAFDLTPAEGRLLSALVNGERLGDYAERTGVKRSTAKTHLRGLFNKVG